MSNFLLLPRLKIHNANAMSSPYTIGFPSVTAWAGAVHALQRFLNQNGFANLILAQFAVSCHDFNLKTYRGKNDYVSSIIGSANPLEKDGSRSAFIEEAKCDLDVSLLIEYRNIHRKDVDKVKELIQKQLHCMKWASGDLISVRNVESLSVDEDEPKTIRTALNKLMPGYVLIERRDLMIQSMENGQDALDALLEYLKLMHRSEVNEQEEIFWTKKRKEKGWIVPISVGFQGITPPKKARNQRDPEKTHRFAESIITLGEFKMPYNFDSLEPLLWQYKTDVENDLYICRTKNH